MNVNSLTLSELKILLNIHKACAEIIMVWKTDIDGDKPMVFKDELARGLFLSDIARQMYLCFRIGRKYQSKKNKIKAVRRFWQSGKKGIYKYTLET